MWHARNRTLVGVQLDLRLGYGRSNGDAGSSGHAACRDRRRRADRAHLMRWPDGCQDRGGRAALDALRRGRSHPAPVHAQPRAGERDRQGRAPRAQPLRGRLEPFFRLRIELHEGRSELLTVTGAQTVDGHARLRGDARALDAAARACDAVGRLFETSEPHPGVFNLLCRKLSLLDEQAGEIAGPARRATKRTSAAGRPPGVSPEAAARRGPGAPARARAPRAASASIWSASPARPGGSCAAPARPRRSRSARRPTAS